MAEHIVQRLDGRRFVGDDRFGLDIGLGGVRAGLDKGLGFGRGNFGFSEIVGIVGFAFSGG